jgi:DNA-binding NtrC family response regulator
MSGHAEPSDIVKAMKLGAVDFLKKPLHDFLPILRNIMTPDESEQEIQHVSGINYSLKLKEARNIFESQYLLHHLQLMIIILLLWPRLLALREQHSIESLKI